MNDAEAWGAAQQSNCMADGAAKKTKTTNKIPQEKRGSFNTAQAAEKRQPINITRQSLPNRRTNAGDYRRARNSWQAMMPVLMAQLESEMTVQLAECGPSDEDKACIERGREELQATIAQLGERWHLEVFGSVASGFSTHSSDMDCSCVLQPLSDKAGEEEKEPDPKEILLERLCPLLRETKNFTVVEEIGAAKVPIVRLRFEDRLDVDLSCQNEGALRNTRLLRAYANIDSRVRDLGVAVKIWAKAADIVGAAQSKLSSYTFTLLMIYFLQVHRDVNLPCLSPGLFEVTANPETRDAACETASNAWTCDLSLAELFFRFIGFYAGDFEWGREVCCPRIGQRRYAQDNVFSALRGRHVHRLHAEDPYFLQRNLHCVLGDTEEVQLQEAFSAAWHSIVRGQSPVGLGPQGAKMELQLNELTGSPLSSPDCGPAGSPNFGPAGSPDFGSSSAPSPWIMVEDCLAKTSAAPALANTSSGLLSSSGSTESGDGCAPLELCASSGESRCSDDEGQVAPGAPPRFRSLQELETGMVQSAQAIATIAKSPLSQAARSPQWGPQPTTPSAAGNSQWWLTLGAHAAAVAPVAPAQHSPAGNDQWWLNLGAQQQAPKEERNLTVHSLQDLERKMTQESSEDGPNVAARNAICSLVGRSFAASATSKIASRISNNLEWQSPCAT